MCRGASIREKDRYAYVRSFNRFDSEDILSMIERYIREATHEIGTVNILIAGRTGVGKSTLINEVFQGRLATTGQGKPVTRETRRFTKKGVPLATYDTRGLELKEYKQSRLSMNWRRSWLRGPASRTSTSMSTSRGFACPKMAGASKTPR